MVVARPRPGCGSGPFPFPISRGSGVFRGGSQLALRALSPFQAWSLKHEKAPRVTGGVDGTGSVLYCSNTQRGFGPEPLQLGTAAVARQGPMAGLAGSLPQFADGQRLNLPLITGNSWCRSRYSPKGTRQASRS